MPDPPPVSTASSRRAPRRGPELILKTVDGRQCHLRAVKLGDRDGPVEGDDRGGVEVDELVVEGEDLRPVGVAYVAGGGVDGVDRCEDLVATRSHPGG